MMFALIYLMMYTVSYSKRKWWRKLNAPCSSSAWIMSVRRSLITSVQCLHLVGSCIYFEIFSFYCTCRAVQTIFVDGIFTIILAKIISTSDVLLESISKAANHRQIRLHLLIHGWMKLSSRRICKPIKLERHVNESNCQHFCLKQPKSYEKNVFSRYRLMENIAKMSAPLKLVLYLCCLYIWLLAFSLQE